MLHSGKPVRGGWPKPSGQLNGGPVQVRNEKARRFLLNMRKKPGVSFEQYFPKADKGALRLLRRLLAFDPSERPTAGSYRIVAW